MREACAALLCAVPFMLYAADDVVPRRYIPLELILGARWDGEQTLAYPRGSYTQSVRRDPATWSGPRDWRHPDTGELLKVYDRRRRGVMQIFAVRRDGTAIGRVADSRFGIRSCDQEAKYPLGWWSQGESRTFHYRCWHEGAERPLDMKATIAIENLDHTYAGYAHALRIRWTLSRVADGRQLDDRTYIFAPDRGAVLTD